MKTMNQIQYFCTIAICSIFIQCSEKEEVHPEIETGTVNITSASTIALNGNIVRLGTFPVSDHGFYYSGGYYHGEGDGVKISLGKNAFAGTFKTEIRRLAQEAGIYNRIYIRAFITNSQGTVYGQTVEYHLPVTQITDFSPTVGKAGDIVSFSGAYLSLKDIKIYFEEIEAKIINVTASSILVEVPEIPHFSRRYNNEVYIKIYQDLQFRSIYPSFRIIP